MFRMGKVFVIYSEKLMTPFFDLQFSEVLRIVQKQKLITYLESWGNFEQKSCAFCVKKLI